MNNLILTKKILDWYDNNKRTLPWRKKCSQKQREYFTLVSEFMLQQTQVSTVIPYFNNFIKKIPNLDSLAKINEKKETIKACSAPKNKGKLKFLIKFPINIMCKAQKRAHKITKPSPNLIAASEKSLNK